MVHPMLHQPKPEDEATEKMTFDGPLEIQVIQAVPRDRGVRSLRNGLKQRWLGHPHASGRSSRQHHQFSWESMLHQLPALVTNSQFRLES